MSLHVVDQVDFLQHMILHEQRRDLLQVVYAVVRQVKNAQTLVVD